MNWLKKLFIALGAYFRSGSAARDAKLALEYVGRALPYVMMAADIVTGITPTSIDDVAWAAVKKSFPALFDGGRHTADELKLAALGAATMLMKQRYPDLSTSVARAAVQLAYLDKQAVA